MVVVDGILGSLDLFFGCSDGAFLFVPWMAGYFSVLSGTWDFLVTVRIFCHVVVPIGILVDTGDLLGWQHGGYSLALVFNVLIVGCFGFGKCFGIILWIWDLFEWGVFFKFKWPSAIGAEAMGGC